MINYIIGTLIEKEGNKIVVEKSGLAFDIFFPNSNFYNINVNEEIQVYIHTVVNTDGIFLYGFLNKEDKKLFEMLLVVNRLGPKGALNLISELGSLTIKQSILKEDSKVLSSVSGIGKKVADKIIIDLFDKMKNFDVGNDNLNVLYTHNEYENLKDEAISALITLGYQKRVAENLVNKVDIVEDMKVEELIKLALKK